jgi:hypothetical protein
VLHTLKHSCFALLAHFWRGDRGVLKIATVVFLSAVSLSVIAAEPKSAATYEAPTKQEADKTETREQPSKAPTKDSANATSQGEQGQQHLSHRFWDFTLTDVLIAAFTGVLVAVGSWQGIHLRRSVKVAERALTDLERPYLFVDLSREPVFQDSRMLETGIAVLLNPVTPIKYWLYNGGRTPAILAHRRHEIVHTGSDEVLPTPVDPNRIEGGDPLPSGTAIDKECPITVDFDAARYGLGDVQINLRGIFLIGFVRYLDIFDNSHVTGFCARYDQRTNQFVLTGDESYNYTRDEGKKTPS